MAGERSIVVGVDGSRTSDAALRWGAWEARHWRRPLRVVHAMGLARYAAEAAVPRLGLAEAEATGQRIVSEATRQAQKEAPDVSVDGAVHVEESAAEALLRQGAGAEMLVLGSRGRGGFGSCCSARPRIRSPGTHRVRWSSSVAPATRGATARSSSASTGRPSRSRR